MKGMAVTMFALIGLDLLLTSKLTEIAPAFGAVTNWLAEWMSPAVPLIPNKAGTGSTSSAAKTSGSGSGLPSWAPFAIQVGTSGPL